MNAPLLGHYSLIIVFVVNCMASPVAVSADLANLFKRIDSDSSVNFDDSMSEASFSSSVPEDGAIDHEIMKLAHDIAQFTDSIRNPDSPFDPLLSHSQVRRSFHTIKNHLIDKVEERINLEYYHILMDLVKTDGIFNHEMAFPTARTQPWEKALDWTDRLMISSQSIFDSILLTPSHKS